MYEVSKLKKLIHTLKTRIYKPFLRFSVCSVGQLLIEYYKIFKKIILWFFYFFIFYSILYREPAYTAYIKSEEPHKQAIFRVYHALKRAYASLHTYTEKEPETKKGLTTAGLCIIIAEVYSFFLYTLSRKK